MKNHLTKTCLPMWAVLWLAIAFFPVFLSAQTTKVHVVRDVESWSSARLQYKLNKKLKFRLSENLRLQHNSSQLQQHFTELSVEYEVFKPFALEAEARYGFKPEDNQAERFVRFFYAANYEQELGRFKLMGRAAFQNRNVMSTDFDFAIATYDLRYRLGTSYDFKNWKLDPELSFELFRKTSVETPEFEKYRIKFSTDYSLKKAGKLSAFVAFEHELTDSYPYNATILGLNYTFTLKRKKNDE